MGVDFTDILLFCSGTGAGILETALVTVALFIIPIIAIGLTKLIGYNITNDDFFK